MASKATRLRALTLYKELHRLGRDYPDPAYSEACSVPSCSWPCHFNVQSAFKAFQKCLLFELALNKMYDFHGRMRALFEKNRNLTDKEEIENALKLGEYIKKETLALYSLRKYRHLKRMYPDSMSEPT